ncbi:MAG: hypothetical protein JSR60_01795 [Proteobacteria bacterium]|nr:hypothetical protein [Pseudomonadota bacterium]
MALVHDSGHRSKDLSVCGLALVILAIIAVAVPVLQWTVNMLFGLV